MRRSQGIHLRALAARDRDNLHHQPGSASAGNGESVFPGKRLQGLVVAPKWLVSREESRLIKEAVSALGCGSDPDTSAPVGIGPVELKS